MAGSSRTSLTRLAIPGWTSPEALELASSLGLADPEAAMRAHVRRLLAEHGPFRLPVKLGAFFVWGNIRRVRLEATLLEGGLVPLPDGRFDILLREDRSPRRRRFTLAHEFGHLFFWRFSPLSKGAQRREARRAPEEEERLCNVAAEEFLMPQTFVDAATRSIAWKDAARTVLAVSEDCDVSTEAAVLRLAPWFPGFGELRLWELSPQGWQVAIARRFGAPHSGRAFAELPEPGLLNLAAMPPNLDRLSFGQSRRWAAAEMCAVRVPRRSRPTVLVAYRRHVDGPPGALARTG